MPFFSWSLVGADDVPHRRPVRLRDRHSMWTYAQAARRDPPDGYHKLPGFWPVKSGQCSNVLPIVSVVGPNYQFQLLPTLSSMFSESLIGAALARAARPAAKAPDKH